MRLHYHAASWVVKIGYSQTQTRMFYGPPCTLMLVFRAQFMQLIDATILTLLYRATRYFRVERDVRERTMYAC